MLNRRLIRIRAMQTLYAYEQARGANLLLAEDLIDDTFAPDLNSMEKQDRHKLEGMAKLGKMLLIEQVEEQKIPGTDEAPAAVLNAVSKAHDYYRQKNKKDAENLHLKAISDAEKVYDIYLKLLQLYLELAAVASRDNSKELPSSLHQLKILDKLAHTTDFENQLLRRSIGFEKEAVFVNKLYREAIKENAKYLEFRAKQNHTAEDELALIKYLLKNVLLKHEVSNTFFELDHMYWSEDKETLRAMVSHTFQSALDQEQLIIPKLDDDWFEKRDFLATLVKKVISEEAELMGYLLPKLKNWEFDRIADTDKILLKLAMVEMMEFSSIPVKVTINEIIEIAKDYSTPKSGQFVNGILDAVSKELSSTGVIKKTGRGMLDNK